MKFKPYPCYKDSGVEWLREVPKHWGIKKLKFSVGLRSDKLQAINSELSYIGLENIESWSGKFLSNDSTFEAEGISNCFKSGDVLFGKLRPYLAKAFLPKIDGLCSSEFLVLQAKKIIPEFLIKFVLSYELINQVDSSTYGVKMPRASWDFVGNLPIPIPPVQEQTAIANFLDRETCRINALVEEKNRFIELLKEKRQALISHAVTKGLDPNVKMKDSGIEWLGEVPEHWVILKIRRISSLQQGLQIAQDKRFYEDGVNRFEYITIKSINSKNLENTLKHLYKMSFVILMMFLWPERELRVKLLLI